MPQSGLANFCDDSAMGFNHHQIGETVVVMGGGGVVLTAPLPQGAPGREKRPCHLPGKAKAKCAPSRGYRTGRAREGIQIHPSCTM